MYNNIFLVKLLDWNSPTTYLLILTVIVAVAAIQAVLEAKTFLKESGHQAESEAMGFSGIFKWTATNEKTFAVILFVIVLIAVIWAL